MGFRFGRNVMDDIYNSKLHWSDEEPSENMALPNPDMLQYQPAEKTGLRGHILEKHGKPPIFLWSSTCWCCRVRAIDYKILAKLSTRKCRGCDEESYHTHHLTWIGKKRFL
jgi:hypothetical protein